MISIIRFGLTVIVLLSLAAASLPAQTTVTTIDRFSLILYDFDSAEPSPINARILKEHVYPEITPRTEISIVGYSDVVGQEEHNYELARLRSNKVASLVRDAFNARDYKSLTATAFGEEHAPYRYDLPEGRFLSRTVIITLKTQEDK